MIRNLVKKINLWFVLVILLAVPSFTTLLQPGYFPMHDDLQIMRIFEMDKCFKDGQLPCRWIPDMGYGFGYPLFNYYPVMPYYLSELIHFIGFNLIWSVKILAILSFLVSAVTMFLLARTFWGNLGGLISSVFYVYAPYHSVDIYVRGAFAESWSLAWTPAVFWSIYQVINNFNLKNLILLAVFSALFLMSHNPLALIFFPVIAIWTLLLLWQSKKTGKLKTLFKLSLGAVWGLGLAAFFTIPVVIETKDVHIETLTIGYFNYLAHFVDIKQLFLSTFWGYGGSIWGPNDGMSFQIGWLHTGVILMAIPLALYFWKRDLLKSLILLFMVAVFWASAFMMHPRANFIWEKLVILQNIQFPWRILSITIFVSSFCAGSLFYVKTKKYLRYTFLIVLLIGVGVLYQGYFRIEKVVPLTDQEKLSGALWDLQRTAGIFDYLPKSAKFPPAGPARENIEVIAGVTQVSSLSKGTDWLRFNTESTTSASLRLPIIYFPEWKLWIDGKEASFDIKNDLGQPTFDVASGKHIVFAKLENTPIRTISNLISVIAFGILVVVFIKHRKRILNED